MPAIVGGTRPAGDKILIGDGVRFTPKERVLILDGVATTGEAAPSYVEKENQGGAASSFVTVAANSGNQYVAFEWPASNTYTLRRVIIKGLATNPTAAAYNWTVEIREFPVTEPSNIVLASKIITGLPTGAAAEIAIDFDPGVAIVSGTDYCVVVHRGGLLSGGNYFRWYYINAGAFYLRYDANGVTPWQASDPSTIVYVKTYALE